MSVVSDLIDVKDRVTVADFERRLQKLSRRHRVMIRQALGNPPDIRNVPNSLWEKIEREHKAALTILLMGAAIPAMMVAMGRLNRSGNRLDDHEEVVDTMRRQAHERAVWVSQSVTNTSRTRLQRYMEGEDVDINGALSDVFGERRWSSVGRNETTAAMQIGGSSVADAARRQQMVVTEIWQLGNCEHCDVCPLLAGTSREFWGIWVPGGPPLHPHCCCFVQLFFDTRDSLMAQGRLNRVNPNAAIVNQRIQKFL